MARLKKPDGSDPDLGDAKEAMSTITLTDKDGNMVFDGTKDSTAGDRARELRGKLLALLEGDLEDVDEVRSRLLALLRVAIDLADELRV